jgi:hypothetical protein
MFYCGNIVRAGMCRRAMYSLDLFSFADMERRVLYGGSIGRVRAVVP